jgi:predicted site-specific integrase-resolvase
VNRLLKPREVAAMLGVSPYTLLEWRRVGFGPPFLRLRGNDLRYEKEALRKWVRSREARSLTEERARGTRYSGAAGRPRA